MAVWSGAICSRQMAAAANLALANFYLNSAASSGLFKENFSGLEVMTRTAAAEAEALPGTGPTGKLPFPVSLLKTFSFPS